MSEEEVERKSLEDLESILKEAREQGIKLVIVGGYSAAGYTRGYRFTKDIDGVSSSTPHLKFRGDYNRSAVPNCLS